MTLVGEIGTVFVKQSGYNADVPETAATIWTGTPAIYGYPPFAAKMFVSSTNSEDGQGTQTGARVVEIWGLNSSWGVISEFVVLSGVNEATTSEYFNRVYLLHIHSAGSAGKNIGEICCGQGSVTNGIPNSMYAHIQSGDNKSLMGVFTVPDSSVCKVYQIQYTVGQDKDVEGSLFYRKSGAVFQLEDRVKVYRNTVNRNWFIAPLELPARTDIEVRAQKDTAGGTIAMTAGLNLLIKPKV